MRLSALEIKKKEFQQRMRGIDAEEVRGFLDKVSEEVELLSREKKESDDKLLEVKQRLDHFLSLEQTLEKTLVAAQSTAIKMEDQAKREAELILRDAQLERDRKLNDVRIDLHRAESELVRLRSEYDTTLARMRSLLAGFTTFVGGLEQERADATLVRQSAQAAVSDTHFAPPTPLPTTSFTDGYRPPMSGEGNSATFQDYEH